MPDRRKAARSLEASPHEAPVVAQSMKSMTLAHVESPNPADSRRDALMPFVD